MYIMVHLKENGIVNSLILYWTILSFWSVYVCWVGVAIAERLKPFKVKKFIYTDVTPRPELADMIQAEYGEIYPTFQI